MAPNRVPGPAQARLVRLLAGILGCALVAALVIGLGRHPGLGLLLLGAAVGLGLAAARRFGRAVPVPPAGPLASVCAGAARAAADGAPAVAIAILEGARGRTGLDGPTARLLIELHTSTDQVSRAVEVALESLHLLAPGDVGDIIASLESCGERHHAAALASAAGPQRTATTNSRGNENSRFPPARAG